MTLRLLIDDVPHVLAAEHHVQALWVAAHEYRQLLRVRGPAVRHLADGLAALSVIAPAVGIDDLSDPRD